MIRNMDKAYLIGQMGKSMTENGFKVNSMERVLLSSQMERERKVPGKWGRKFDVIMNVSFEINRADVNVIKHESFTFWIIKFTRSILF